MQYIFIIISFLAINLSAANFSQEVNSLEEIQEESFSPKQMKKVKKLIEGVSKKDIQSLDAGKLYKQTCSACHGRKGGLGLGGATDLTTSEIDLNTRVAMIYFGKNAMTPYKGALKNAEIVALAKYVKTLRK